MPSKYGFEAHPRPTPPAAQTENKHGISTAREIFRKNAPLLADIINDWRTTNGLHALPFGQRWNQTTLIETARHDFVMGEVNETAGDDIALRCSVDGIDVSYRTPKEKMQAEEIAQVVAERTGLNVVVSQKSYEEIKHEEEERSKMKFPQEPQSP